MTSQSQHRAEVKLRYARIHLDELRHYAKATTNDEWENAHQESCLYHLAGSVEAILHEINDGYSLKLDLGDIRKATVSKRLKASNQSSAAFDHLMELWKDDESWLALLFEWRNHGTHRQRIGKIVYLSTRRRVDNEFKDPRTGQPQTVYPGLKCLKILDRLSEDVEELISYCRSIDPGL